MSKPLNPNFLTALCALVPEPNRKALLSILIDNVYSETEFRSKAVEALAEKLMAWATSELKAKVWCPHWLWDGTGWSHGPEDDFYVRDSTKFCEDCGAPRPEKA